MGSAKYWLNRIFLIDRFPKPQSDHSACDATHPAALLIYISSHPNHSYKLLISHVKPLTIDRQLDRELFPKTRNVNSSHRLLRAANSPLVSDLEGIKVADSSRSKDERKVSLNYAREVYSEVVPSPVRSPIRPSARVALPQCKVHFHILPLCNGAVLCLKILTAWTFP